MDKLKVQQMIKNRLAGQQIAGKLKEKGYTRDVANNTFYKKTGAAFYDYNEIRFFGEYIIITNLEHNLNHKTLLQ